MQDMLDNPYRSLTTEEACELYYNASLNDLMYVAMINRNAKVPGKIVTYLVDRNINYTNICTSIAMSALFTGRRDMQKIIPKL